MKKIALLLFIIFATVQVAPTLFAAKGNGVAVFIADEEKAEDNGKAVDGKEKKDYATVSSQVFKLTLKLKSVFHLTEKMYVSPPLEKLTPPPNFC